MLIGYARVSTEDQNLDLQRDALEKAGVDPGQIYEEFASGAKAKRPELTACLRTLREDDTLVICRLDRLGRSVPDLIKILDQLKAKGVGLRSLTDNFDTTTAMGIMVFHMLATFAQFERDLVQEVVEECALQVRHDCTACEGTGHFLDGTGEPTECEYCGRPMAAIRARS